MSHSNFHVSCIFFCMQKYYQKYIKSPQGWSCWCESHYQKIIDKDPATDCAAKMWFCILLYILHDFGCILLVFTKTNYIYFCIYLILAILTSEDILQWLQKHQMWCNFKWLLRNIKHQKGRDIKLIFCSIYT